MDLYVVKADCCDSAVPESIKIEFIERRPLAARPGAGRATSEHSEFLYNAQRLHSRFGHVSPAEYEGTSARGAALAAQRNRPPNRGKVSRPMPRCRGTPIRPGGHLEVVDRFRPARESASTQ